MPSKYVDTTSIIQVIGNVYNNPSLLDFEDKYTITDEDFPDEFHRIVFGTIYKLHELGAEKVSLETINDFLNSRPNILGVFKKNKGEEWLLTASKNSVSDSFDYYYNRLKKFTLLRAYDNYGVDVSDIYDIDNLLDSKKKQQQEDWLDNASLENIADKIDHKIEGIRLKYVNDISDEAYQAGEGIRELVEQLKKYPEVGIPMYGPLINTVTRGMRLGKFYLRSAPTGYGKTRALVADACYAACDRYYNDQFGWLHNGLKEPALFIATEQDLSEIQTLILAFLSNVNEEHILNGTYEEGEWERILTAIEILEDSPLYIECIPDFSLQDIENCIKKNIREHDVRFIFYDYLHTSMKILEEVTRRSGGVKLREDNVLFMLSTKLKDICVQYGVFIMSATQLNGQFSEAETPDQNLLRGSKAIADRIDNGMILLGVSNEDLTKLEPILGTNNFAFPNMKLSIYKNRRGRYKGIYLWCTADLGTCRINPIFATDYNFNYIPIDDTIIKVEPESAF